MTDEKVVKLAPRLFATSLEMLKLEDGELMALVESLGVGWEDWSFDHYDDSLEIYGVPAADRLSLEAQSNVKNEGFAIIWLNHSDGWETQYCVERGREYRTNRGRQRTFEEATAQKRIREAHELGRTQGPQWIDVREEMPEPGVTVLAIATGSSEVRFLKLFYDGEGAGECGCAEGHEIHGEYWWHEAHSEDLAEDLYLDTGFHSVTHWMPLPKPPVG